MFETRRASGYRYSARQLKAIEAFEVDEGAKALAHVVLGQQQPYVAKRQVMARMLGCDLDRLGGFIGQLSRSGLMQITCLSVGADNGSAQGGEDMYRFNLGR
jgi:hypothetical protein